MKLFKTSNNLTMVECLPYNWLVQDMYAFCSPNEENPLTYSITLGSPSHHISFEYFPLKQLLKFNDLSMKINTWHEASQIIEKIKIGLIQDNELSKEISDEQDYSMDNIIYSDKPNKTDYNKVDYKEISKFNNVMKQYNKLLRYNKIKRILE